MAAKPTPAANQTHQTLSNEDANNAEQLSHAVDARMQALIIGDTTAGESLTAEKVIHLLPIENLDGTTTYMMIQSDKDGIRIDVADGPPMHGPVDPIYVADGADVTSVLQTIIHESTPPKTPTENQSTLAEF